jgi:hypothetical protein
LEEIELTQIENTYDTKKHLQNCGTANWTDMTEMSKFVEVCWWDNKQLETILLEMWSAYVVIELVIEHHH